MPAISVPSRRAWSFGFALAICVSCATYVDHAPEQGSPSGASGGDGGSAGAAGAGSPPLAGKANGGMTGGGMTGATAGTSAGVSSGGGGSGSDGGTTGAGAGGANAGGGQGGGGGNAGAGGTANGGAATAGNAGNGGNGGATQGPTCARNPISAKASWTVTASHSRPNSIDPVGNTKDGVLTNRWSSGKDQSGNEWLQVDFGAAVMLTQVTLRLGDNPDDYPREYEARLSGTSQNMAAPVLDSGMGAEATDTVLDFPAGSVGRYLLISQGGEATALWWSVAEIEAECAD